MNTRVSSVISTLISIITFFFVFNTFYSISPTPITIVTMEDVNTFAPKAYVHPYEQPVKILANEKSWRGYKVIEYWYMWNYDGPDVRPDWEPVILLIDGGHVKAVISRIHYSWRVLYEFPTDGVKPIVTFLYGYHTPTFRPPLSDWVEVTTPVLIGTPPENINYDEVLGWSILPTESAIASAVVLGIASASIVYIIAREIIIWISIHLS